MSSKEGVARSTFLVPPDLVRLAMSAKRIGHLMKPSSHVPSIGVSVDINENSAFGHAVSERGATQAMKI